MKAGEVSCSVLTLIASILLLHCGYFNLMERERALPQWKMPFNPFFPVSYFCYCYGFWKLLAAVTQPSGSEGKQAFSRIANIQPLLQQERCHPWTFVLLFIFPWQPLNLPKKRGATTSALGTSPCHVHYWTNKSSAASIKEREKVESLEVIRLPTSSLSPASPLLPPSETPGKACAHHLSSAEQAMAARKENQTLPLLCRSNLLPFPRLSEVRRGMRSSLFFIAWVICIKRDSLLFTGSSGPTAYSPFEVMILS